VFKDSVDFFNPFDWSGGHSTPAGSELTGDPTGAKAPRRLQDLPAESECPERKSTAKLKETAQWTASFFMVNHHKNKRSQLYQLRLPFIKEHICE
jgi:hypothetical protein